MCDATADDGPIHLTCLHAVAAERRRAQASERERMGHPSPRTTMMDAFVAGYDAGYSDHDLECGFKAREAWGRFAERTGAVKVEHPPRVTDAQPTSEGLTDDERDFLVWVTWERRTLNIAEKVFLEHQRDGWGRTANPSPALMREQEAAWERGRQFERAHLFEIVEVIRRDWSSDDLLGRGVLDHVLKRMRELRPVDEQQMADVFPPHEPCDHPQGKDKP